MILPAIFQKGLHALSHFQLVGLDQYVPTLGNLDWGYFLSQYGQHWNRTEPNVERHWLQKFEITYMMNSMTVYMKLGSNNKMHLCERIAKLVCLWIVDQSQIFIGYFGTHHPSCNLPSYDSLATAVGLGSYSFWHICCNRYYISYWKQLFAGFDVLTNINCSQWHTYGHFFLILLHTNKHLIVHKVFELTLKYSCKKVE